VWLDSSLQTNQGPFLSAQPSHCITIPFCLGSQGLKTLTLLDSRASTCFLDEEFIRLHKIHIVKKLSLVHVEVIDRRPLSSGDNIHKTTPLEVNLATIIVL
jgi:hypothetical protein